MFLLLLFFIIALMLHYALNFLNGTQNPTLFIIALVLVPLYFAIAIVYSLIQIIIKKRNNQFEDE